MATKRLTNEQVVALLGEGPSNIADAARHASAEQLVTAPAKDEWSANEILAHMRACADVWGGAIETILAQDRPTIRAMNPRRWIESTEYLDRPFRSSLRAFAAQRRDLLTLLTSLSSGQWARRATVTGAGKPLVRSVYDYAEWLATHERPHVKQIRRAVEAVSGPSSARDRPRI